MQVSGEGLDAAPRPAGQAGRAQAHRQRSVCGGTPGIVGALLGVVRPLERPWGHRALRVTHGGRRLPSLTKIR